MSIDPEDLNDSNTYITPIGANGANAYTNGIYHFCATGCTNSTFFKPNAGTGTSDNRWKYFMPTVDAAKAVLVNGKKYIKQFYKTGTSSHPGWDGYVGHVVWTLNHDKTEVILASKFIYSTDGTPENVVEPPTGASVPTQTPDENFASPVGLKIWEKFESFEAIFAKIAMIENGTIGGAVYSGDFMFSQKGVGKQGNESTSYQTFNRNHIYDSDSNFKPNICMDFNNGKMWACSGNIEFTPGEIYMSGHIRKQETLLNMNEFYDKYLLTGTKHDGVYEPDFKKLGSFVVLTGYREDYTRGTFELDLPGTKSWYYTNITGDAKVEHLQYLRGIVGNTYIIYNLTQAKNYTQEDLLQGTFGTILNFNTSYPTAGTYMLFPGEFLKIEIVLDVAEDSKYGNQTEVIYSNVTKGKMLNYTMNDPWISGRPRQ
jgi:hypothetical protein